MFPEPKLRLHKDFGLMLQGHDPSYAKENNEPTACFGLWWWGWRGQETGDICWFKNHGSCPGILETIKNLPADTNHLHHQHYHQQQHQPA